MKKPWRQVVRGNLNNWETYMMKGEWLRALSGLADRAGRLEAIEASWNTRQRGHFSAQPWSLYHDRSSDPDTLSVEAVGRGNLLALIILATTAPARRRFARRRGPHAYDSAVCRIRAGRTRPMAAPTITCGWTW